MPVHRLRGDDINTWHWYPTFEARVLALAKKSGVPIVPVQAAWDLRNRFVNAPLSAGYWLFTKDDAPAEVCGHVCGWLTVNMGMLGVFLFQAEGPFTDEHRKTWVTQVDEWMNEMNSMRGRLPYIPNGPPINNLELVTPNRGDVMSRYIQGLGFEEPQTLTILNFRRKAKPLAQAKPAPNIDIPKGLMN